ncbi:uncharacterized protein A4U43_C02F4720 [Asparagus officinalis]|uniref:Uncharacterized protein n=1 Tax=Asparagus officinalis TaxID=4686 RepID=A0A5P1FKZ6_ASPOF|nr:uncharacterized protein A4U43_C02F4720 [Asparagus officinalis]
MQALASTHDFLLLPKREREVDIGATFERAAKRARREEATIDADTREGQVVADPSPNLGATLSITESIPPTLDVLVPLDQLTVLEGSCLFVLCPVIKLKSPTLYLSPLNTGTTEMIALVPSDGGEEKEELLDYSGRDDLAFRRSSILDSSVEDLEITSSLPVQMPSATTLRISAC